jgi:protein gp37
MGEQTKIGWCDATWNPWRGCSKVSPGCARCYAERHESRFGTVQWGPNGTRVVTTEANWKKPLKWNREQHDRQAWCSANSSDDAPPFRVFCASLADVFEDWEGQVGHSSGLPMYVMDEPNGHPYRWAAGHVLDRMTSGRPLTLADVRQRLFELIDQTPHLTWLLLTKRPENILRFWPGNSEHTPSQMTRRNNVWLGTTIESHNDAIVRVPKLLAVAHCAAKLFLSAEPLLSGVRLDEIACENTAWPGTGQIDWLIAGCESGPQRRPMQLEWCDYLLRVCRQKNIAFFMKQMEIAGKVVTDVSEFPKELQVQEFPK